MRASTLLASIAEMTVLHGGHPAASFEAFQWSYLVASVLIVGGLGGGLYWYYGSRLTDST